MNIDIKLDQVWTIGTEENVCHGHGCNIEQIHICPKDAYGYDKFHPCFPTKEQAEEYLKSLDLQYNMVVVPLDLHGHLSIS